MKRMILAAIAAVSVGAIMSRAQTNDYTIRQIRDPVQMQSELNGDMIAVNTRLTALEASTNVNGIGVFKALTIGASTVQTNETVGGTLTVNTLSATGTAASVAATQMVFTAAATAAPTNSASAGIRVRVNGTNYWIGLLPPNS